MRFFEILFEDIWSDIATKWSDKENIPLDQVETYINKYKQLKQKNMFDKPEHKDIQHIYKNMDFLQFKQLVDQTEQKANQTKGAMRSKIKNSKDAIVYRDDSDWLIVVPKNTETSQNIGTETKWCTSTREASNRFDQYTIQENGTMVYLINKHEEQKLSNDKSKYAIRFNDETGNIIEIENPSQDPYNLPEKRFTKETGFNPHEVVALIRNSSEWKNYSENKYEGCSLIELIDFGKINQSITRIKNGARVNIRAENGTTPLHHAVCKGYVELTRLLLENGADVDMKDDNGNTPLIDVCCYNYTVLVELLIGHGADINIKNYDGMTALMKSCYFGKKDVVNLLLDYDRTIIDDIKDYDENNALLIAANEGHTEIVKMLLDHGADINAQNCYNRTSLMRATNQNDFETVKLLLDYGADVNVKDVNGKTARDIAKNYPDLLELFEFV